MRSFLPSASPHRRIKIKMHHKTITSTFILYAECGVALHIKHDSTSSVCVCLCLWVFIVWCTQHVHGSYNSFCIHYFIYIYISINNRRHRRLMMMMNEQANLELKINSLSLSAQFQFSPVHSRDDDLFFKQFSSFSVFYWKKKLYKLNKALPTWGLSESWGARSIWVSSLIQNDLENAF